MDPLLKAWHSFVSAGNLVPGRSRSHGEREEARAVAGMAILTPPGAQHGATRGKQGRERQLLRRTATVLQPGWYGPVRSGTTDVATAGILTLVSYVLARGG